MMQYMIIEKSSSYKLLVEVRDYIEQGWVPQGGVTVSITSFHEAWAQAMVKNNA